MFELGRIWNRCRKFTYVEEEIVTFETYLAVLKFTDGDISFLMVFHDLDMELGFSSCKGAEACETARIMLSAPKKATEKVKMRRKTLGQRNKYIDHAKDNVG